MKLTLEQACAALRGLGQLKAPTELARAKAILDLKRALKPHVEPIEETLRAIEVDYMQAVWAYQEQAKANPNAPMGVPLDVQMRREDSLKQLDVEARAKVIELDDELRIPEACITDNKVSPQTLEDLDPVVAWKPKPKNAGE